MIHPQTRADRLRLKEALDAKKKKQETEREGRVRRKLFREQAKLKETEDELHSYDRDGNLQGKSGRPNRSIPLSD